MMTSRSRGAAVGASLFLAAAAHAQLRVVTWNISNYSGGRDADIKTAVYGVVPAGLALAGRSMSPDVICGQEFISAAALNNFVNDLNTAPGSPGDWAAAPFIDGADTDAVFVYRTSKVNYLRTVTIALGSSATDNQPRNTYRYDFRPVGYTATTTTIAAYVSHLKAGTTGPATTSGTDMFRRLVEATRIRNNAAGTDTNGPGTALPAGYNFFFCGDMNIQSSSEAAYQEFVSAGPAQFFDPINTPATWYNSATYKFIHTQDPSGTGGMDDRFDQILLCATLRNSTAGPASGPGMGYIGNPAAAFSTSTWNDPNHSYRCWGNDGNSFNTSLNTTSNTEVGNAIAQAIINVETAAGGHCPVYLDMRVPAKVTSSTTIDFGAVQQNALATRTLTVSNNGDVALWTAPGIANLSYTLSASSGFTAPSGTFTDAPGAAANSHTITMSTATVGPKSGTITITSNDPDQPTRTVTLTGTVAAPNQPPVADAGPDQTLRDIDGNGVEPVTLNGSASHDPDGSITTYRWTEGQSLLAQSAQPTSTVPLPVGAHTVTLQVTDNGGLTATDTVLITINPHCVADVDDGSGTGTPDGGVTVDDLLFYLSIFNAGDIRADVDDGSGTGTPDGGITIDDLLYYLARFNTGC